MGNIGIMLEYINCYFSRYCNLNESFKVEITNNKYLNILKTNLLIIEI